MGKEGSQEALEKIQNFLEVDRNGEAVSEAESYIKKWGNNDILAILHGEALIRTGNLSKALSVINAGLQENSSNFELYYMLGQLYETEGNIKAAGICYRFSLFVCKEKGERTYLNEQLAGFKERHNQNDILKTAVFLCARKNPEWLRQSIEQISKDNPDDSYGIIAMIPRAWEKKYTWLSECRQSVKIVLVANENQGAFNKGIEEAENRSDVLIVSENIHLLPQTLFHLQLNSKIKNRVGILTPVVAGSNSPDGICVVPGGAVYYIGRQVMNECGWPDTKFSNLEYRMADLGFKAIRQGYFLYQSGDAQIEDRGYAGENIRKEEQEVFYTRWGVRLSYSCFARRDVLVLLAPDTPKDLHILEVGCACGATLLAIREQYPEASLYGIELEEGPAAIARNFADIRTGNIETTALDYTQEFFDYIIFGDVLEHLLNPEEVLKNIMPFLKKGGRVLASIPNVMHISVMKNLLAGHWTYEDAGILDRTHLRFFTCTEVAQMFQRAGYEVEEMAATQIAISREDEKMISQLATLGNVSPQFYSSYQYIIRAKRKG